MVKKRILAMLLAVSMILPSALPASAKEPAAGESVEQGAGDTPQEEQNSETTELPKQEPEEAQGKEQQESSNTEVLPEPEKEQGASEVQGEAKEAKPEQYRVILDLPESGTLTFPVKMDEVQADENDPWTPMQEALKRQEELEKKGQETERTAAPDEEVTVHVSSDYGYELTCLLYTSDAADEL